MLDPRPLILTALLEPGVMAKLEAMRRHWYPPERNQVPAHVSLFHQLPGREFDAVKRRLKAIAAECPPPRVTVAGVKSLGQGVALRLASPDLVALRGELADDWDTLLIPQDRAGFDPHVTIQNKASPAQARACFQALSASFVPYETRAVALAVWRYLDGPWQPLAEIGFRGR